MNKLLYTILLTFTLLVPQGAIKADSDVSFVKKNKSEKTKWIKRKHGMFFRVPFATKKELALVIQDIVDVNASLSALESEVPDDLAATLAALRTDIDALAVLVGVSPEELAAALEPLQADIDANTSDLTLALDDITGIQQDIIVINKRLNALETSGPSQSDLVFSGFFTQSSQTGFGLKFEWAEFKSNATGSFAAIEIRNSVIDINGTEVTGSAKCATSTVADAIVKEFNTHVPIAGVIVSFTCFEPTLSRDVEWNIGNCGGDVELNAKLLSNNVCLGGQGATVRPLIGNASWGGVGSNFGGFGGTSSAPSQILEVILTR